MCSVLTHQIPSERGSEQDVEGRNDPDVLLKQEGRVQAFGLGLPQAEAALSDGKNLKRRLTHA